MKTPKYLLDIAEKFPGASLELSAADKARKTAYQKVRMMVDPMVATGIASGLEEAKLAAKAVKRGEHAYRMHVMWGSDLGGRFHDVLLAIDEIVHDAFIPSATVKYVKRYAVQLQKSYEKLESYAGRE